MKTAFTLAAAAACVSFVSGSNITINTNDVVAKYVAGSFNDGEFPMAIGHCNPTDVVGPSFYQKAECNSEEEVRIDYFLASDSTCVGVVAFTQTFDSSFQSGLGTIYDFNCDDDAVDAFVEIDFSLTACEDDPTYLNFFAALNACTFVGYSDYLDDNSTKVWDSIYVYCDEDYAELQYFDAPQGDSGAYYGVCTEDLWDSVATVGAECDYMLTTNEQDVYGYVIECKNSNFTTTADMPTTTDSSSGDDDDDDDDDSAFAFNLVYVMVVAAFGALMQ